MAADGNGAVIIVPREKSGLLFAGVLAAKPRAKINRHDAHVGAKRFCWRVAPPKNLSALRLPRRLGGKIKRSSAVGGGGAEVEAEPERHEEGGHARVVLAEMRDEREKRSE